MARASQPEQWAPQSLYRLSQARIQGRWNGWIFIPLFLSPLLSFFFIPQILTSNSSTRLWFYYIITKIHPPFENPGSAPVSDTWNRDVIVTLRVFDIMQVIHVLSFLYIPKYRSRSKTRSQLGWSTGSVTWQSQPWTWQDFIVWSLLPKPSLFDRKLLFSTFLFLLLQQLRESLHAE